MQISDFVTVADFPRIYLMSRHMLSAYRLEQVRFTECEGCFRIAGACLVLHRRKHAPLACVFASFSYRASKLGFSKTRKLVLERNTPVRY
jgi:hypothetical protein